MRIAQEKIEELFKFFPALKNEIIDQRGAKNSSSFQRDYIKLVFKNGSYLDIVAARQSSRGKIKIFDDTYLTLRQEYNITISNFYIRSIY